jgi:hypothetical protein
LAGNAGKGLDRILGLQSGPQSVGDQSGEASAMAEPQPLALPKRMKTSKGLYLLFRLLMFRLLARIPMVLTQSASMENDHG